jgi:hypothetical protein
MPVVSPEAMALLGVRESDLEPLSLAHFMKFTKSIDEATQLFVRHTDRRAKLLEDLRAKQSDLTHAPRNLRLRPEVLHKQQIITILTQQKANMDQQNERVLRRLAIQEARTILDSQKEQAQSARSEAKTEAFREKVRSARRKMQEAVESRTYTARPTPPEEPRRIKDVAAHLQRAQAVRDSQRRQLEQNAARFQEQAAKAHQTSIELLNQTIAKAQGRVDDTSRRLALFDPKVAEWRGKLQAKGSERDNLAREKQSRVRENEAQRVERERQELHAREERSMLLQQKNADESQAKLARFHEEFERKSRAVEDASGQIRHQREETVRAMLEHQVETEERMKARDREERAKAFERATAKAERAEEIRRLGRIRMSEIEKEKRDKVDGVTGSLASLQPEMLKVLSARERAKRAFDEKRLAITDLHRNAKITTEAELVTELGIALGVNAMEAQAIVHTAKQPPSLYVR